MFFKIYRVQNHLDFRTKAVHRTAVITYTIFSIIIILVTLWISDDICIYLCSGIRKDWSPYHEYRYNSTNKSHYKLIKI